MPPKPRRPPAGPGPTDPGPHRKPPAPESLDPAHVLLMLDDADARRRVTSWLGPKNVDEMLDFARRDALPGSGRRRVILLHGIMGGQLIDRRGLLDDVIWFDLPQLLYAGGLERLRLTVDGLGDAMPQARLEPSRPLRVVYDLLWWHLAGVGGFRVHPIAYDWRKSIDRAAERLAGQIESLAAGDVEARFSVVAHSMGGVVATRYAMLYPEQARRRLDRLVFLGVPLAGCFEPFQLWAGVHPTAARVDRVAPGRGETVRQVWATFPGMAELCPDPAQFDCETLLDPATWPDLAPLAGWLKHARGWRSAFRVPDFLRERLDVVLSADHDTCVGLVRGPDGVRQRHAPGDGAVPAASAWCDGARHWLAPAFHPLLPLDHTVRTAVVALLATGECGLRRVGERADLPGDSHEHGPGELDTTRDPTGLFDLPEEGAPAGPPGSVGDPGPETPGDPSLPDLRDRAGRGELCNGDAMWLFGCDAERSPGSSETVARAPRNTPPRGPGRPDLGGADRGPR